MASKTQIANMALSHLGVGVEIANIETEQSQEATACRRFYDVALQATLRDYQWPFATKQATLSLIESLTASTDEWDYSYRYPSDCIDARRILSGTRNDSRQSRAPFRILKDSSARIIYTDQENAILEYTELVDDPGFYPPDFQLAFSYRLAYLIAPKLTKGDPFGLMDKIMKLYDAEISRAKAASVNEEQADELVDSEFVRMRS